MDELTYTDGLRFGFGFTTAIIITAEVIILGIVFLRWVF